MDSKHKDKLLKALSQSRGNAAKIREAVNGYTSVSKALREAEFNLLVAEHELRKA